MLDIVGLDFCCGLCLEITWLLFACLFVLAVSVTLVLVAGINVF